MNALGTSGSGQWLDDRNRPDFPIFAVDNSRYLFDFPDNALFKAILVGNTILLRIYEGSMYDGTADWTWANDVDVYNIAILVRPGTCI